MLAASGGEVCFPFPGINPRQIRGALGEQTRPGQGKKKNEKHVCVLPGEQPDAQASQAPTPR